MRVKSLRFFTDPRFSPILSLLGSSASFSDLPTRLGEFTRLRFSISQKSRNFHKLKNSISKFQVYREIWAKLIYLRSEVGVRTTRPRYVSYSGVHRSRKREHLVKPPITPRRFYDKPSDSIIDLESFSFRTFIHFEKKLNLITFRTFIHFWD